MLKNWLKVFLFNTKKNKLFTVLNTLGLGIGIAGIIFAILNWNDENSYEKWNPELDNIYEVITTLNEDTQWAYSVAPLETYLKEITEIEGYSYTTPFYLDYIIEANDKKIYNKKGISIQKSFLEIFPYKFLRGSKETAFNDSKSILISEKIAKFFFKEENPIGKNIKYAEHDFTITGVFKVPGKSNIEPEIITSIEKSIEGNKDSWGNFNYLLLLNIKNSKNVEKVCKKIEEAYFKNRTEKNAKKEGIPVQEFIKKHGKISIELSPLKSARLKGKNSSYPEGKGNYIFLMIMVVLSTLILILSIVNYINLATANAIKRAKEVGVRKVIGASKLSIVYQFVFETIITTVFAIILALAIVELTLPYYNNFLNKELSVHSTQFILQLILILVLVVLVAGVFPAVYISNFKALKVLKGSFDRSKSGTWLRNGMLILQFAIASFFIIGSYIVHKQVNYLATKDLGFKSAQILEISYHRMEKEPKDIMRKFETVKSELLKIKGVEKLMLASFRIGKGSSSSSGFSYNDKMIQADNMASSYGFLDMFNIKVKQGRALQAQFASDSIENITINETAQRMMQEKNPIGKTIKWNGEKLKIVGVVEDFDIQGPHKETPPMIFMHLKTVDWMAYNANNFYVKISPENMEETIANIEAFWGNNLNSKYPFEYEFVDKSFAKTYKEYVQQRNLFGVLNVIVVLISLFGLFSLASFSIQRNMRTIAIKKTLGAETKTLLFQLSKQYILFCIIGFSIAVFPVIHFLNKWLETFYYRVEISLMPFIIGFVVLLLLTLIIVIGRAYQATKVDVLTYLKHE